MSKKGLKTPLRYPGGKSRACTKMGQFFPDLREYVEFREPFLGGGSVLFGILQKFNKKEINIKGKIYAYDYNPYLISLYKNIKKKPEEFYEEVNSLKEKINSIKNNNEENNNNEEK